jgi:hypothetical protein
MLTGAQKRSRAVSTGGSALRLRLRQHVALHSPHDPGTPQFGHRVTLNIRGSVGSGAPRIPGRSIIRDGEALHRFVIQFRTKTEQISVENPGWAGDILEQRSQPGARPAPSFPCIDMRGGKVGGPVVKCDADPDYSSLGDNPG